MDTVNYSVDPISFNVIILVHKINAQCDQFALSDGKLHIAFVIFIILCHHYLLSSSQSFSSDTNPITPAMSKIM